MSYPRRDINNLFIDGVEVTATAAELNALDGVTATAAEINILDGVTAVTRMFDERQAADIPHPIPADYTITNTSERVVSLILGTARLSNSWDGIRENDLG